MFGNLMDKMQEAQQQMQEVKDKLSSIFVEAEAEGGLVKVKADGNRKIRDITISELLVKQGDTEAIEELVLTAINRVLDKAEQIAENEIQGAAKDLLPNIPGLF
jgi:hypothetical protein